MLILVLGGGTYVAYTLNLLGPMMQMANAASNQAVEIGKEKLREFLESNETARQAIGISTGRGPTRTATGISMDTLDSRGKKKNYDGADDGDDDDI